MVTIPIRFTCDKCGAFIDRHIKFDNRMTILLGELPEGWILDVRPNVIRAYCPLHAMDVK